MTVQGNLEEWAEKHVFYKKGFSGKHYSEFICHIMNMFDKRVRGCECEWYAPYGRVISADCEKHN